MKKTKILLSTIVFLICTQFIFAQEYFEIDGKKKIFSNEKELLNDLEEAKKSYNKYSPEKYGYIAKNVSYSIIEKIKRNDSIITRVSLELELLKVNNSKEIIFELLGKPLPDFSSKNLKGEEVYSKNLAKKITLINFWFVNCMPCIKEIPELNKLKKDYGDRVNFVAISFDNSEKINNFLKNKEFNFDHLTDQRDIVENSFKVESYPKLLVSDREGKIRLVANGLGEKKDSKLKNTISINELRTLLDDLLK